MTRTMLLMVGLLAVNAVLLGTLAERMHSSAAHAQMAGGGGYLFASGQSNLGGVIYVLNTDKGMMSGLIAQGNTVQNPVYIAPHSVSSDIKRILKR